MPFDFGAARARARPWVKNPLLDWACSFLLDSMRILHHALSKRRHAPIGGCLVQHKPDNRAPRGDAGKVIKPEFTTLSP